MSGDMRRNIAAAVLIALALGLSACGQASDTTEGSSGARTVEVRMIVREVWPDVAQSFEVGDEVRVKNTGALVGEVTSVETTQSLFAVETAEGELNATENPVMQDVFLVIEGEAEVSESGYAFNGTNVYINDQIVYLTPTISFFGIVTSMEAAGE